MNNLLTPRYKVVADYPDSNQPLNSLLIQTSTVPLFENNINGCKMRFSSIQKYPHIFRKLEWWENLPESNFPKFCKVGLVVVNSDDVCIDECNNRIYVGQDEYLFHKCTLLPATEKEYTDYINSL